MHSAPSRREADGERKKAPEPQSLPGRHRPHPCPSVRIRGFRDPMAPAIVLSPMPRWRHLLGLTLQTASFLLVAVAAFWLGRHTAGADLDDLIYPPFATAAAMPPAAAERIPSAAAPVAAVTEPSRVAEDGMTLESFTFRQDGPRSGRYRFAAVNMGRRFLGEVQIHIEGRRQGEAVELTLPPEVAGNPKVSIRQRLHSGGAIQLPEGVSVEKAEIRLIQDGAVRARRALDLADGNATDSGRT